MKRNLKRAAEGERPRPPATESPRRGGGPTPPAPSRPRIPSWLWVVLLTMLVTNYLIAPRLLNPAPTRVDVPYTIFKEQVSAGNVVEITGRGDAIEGRFNRQVTWPSDGQEGSLTSTSFTTRVPLWEDRELQPLLESNGVVVNAESADAGRSLFLSLLVSFGPAILIFGFLFWMASRAQQGAQSGVFGLGKSRARRYEQTGESPKVTFADVAGIDEAEAELVEVVDFLKNPTKYQRLGGTIPKGVLLVGAPGTGKTLLGKAVAGEAGVPFFSMSGSEFVEMIVGVGAARVRDLFANAKKESPCIIFVDELDAIGRRRGGGGMTGGHEEREQTLNQLLVEMDGFDSRQAVIVLAATNRPDVLDPALLRPGRFDRRIIVPRPDKNGREAILKVHVRSVSLSADVDLANVAAATPGLVGAELRNLVNEAALLAARREKDAVDRRDFQDSLEKIVLGVERQLALRPEDRRRVAYHEAGHALIGLLSPEADPVHKVSIIPRGQALGVTYQMPEDDRHNYSEPYLRARITGALGGRAAEEVVCGVPTTGAENDLKQVTDLARQMVTRWGMSKEVGLLFLDQGDNDFLGGGQMIGRAHSEATATLVDREVRRIIDECHVEALRLLNAERDLLDVLAEALLKRESLDEEEILAVTGLKSNRGRAAADAANGLVCG